MTRYNETSERVGIYMGERNDGFLWDNERAYIRGQSDNRRVKSLLKNESATAAALGDRLAEFRSDLELTKRFWRDRMAEDGGRYYWEDIVLPANEAEIRKLRDLLHEWLTQAEVDFTEHEDNLLENHLYPIWQDLELNSESSAPPVRHFFGRSDGSDPDTGMTPHAELIARRDAILHLLEEPDLYEILRWIDRHPDKKIPKKIEYKNNDWKWAASRWLRNTHGLLEQWGGHNHVYEFTRRGEAVRDTLNELSTSEAPAVANLNEKDTLRTWSRLLNRRLTLTE